MKLTFLCFGSRGDVQPYIAPVIGFKRAGYDVRIATHDIFKELVISKGLEFAMVKSNPREMLEGNSAREAQKTALPAQWELWTEFYEACNLNQLIIFYATE